VSTEAKDPRWRGRQTRLFMRSFDPQSDLLRSETLPNDVGAIARLVVGEQRPSSIGGSATSQREPGTIRIVGKIQLMQAWTSVVADRLFTNQTFEIRPELKFARLGIDGCLMVTSRPKNITWYGGAPADFEGIVHIKLSSYGIVIIDEPLCIEYHPPVGVPGGVNFDIMPRSD
jgi:hypothetical protein